MRLDKNERIALKNALKDFNGAVYLFGSRLDDAKYGGRYRYVIIYRKTRRKLTL